MTCINDYEFICRIDELMVFYVSGNKSISPGCNSLRNQKGSTPAAAGNGFYPVPRCT
jgi:hypothetical protein